MEMRSYLICLVVGCLMAAVSEAVVWGPRRRGEIQPKALEIPDVSSESLSAAAAEMEGRAAKRLHRRQTSNGDGVGYTTPLTNDTHTFALVHWTGYPSEALFILTRRRTRTSGYRYSDQSWLWRSLDYGHTFNNETYKWDVGFVAEWYYISAYSQYLIFADRIHNQLYITLDEGETYNHSDISFRPDKLTFQSRYINHSIDYPYNNYVLGYDSQNRSLWVSLDVGLTWRKLSDNVVEERYYWRSLSEGEGLATVYFEKNITADLSMLYVVDDVATNSTPRLFDASLGNFIVNSFVLEREYMFVQKADAGSGGVVYSSPLWVSHNRQSFRQARFPLQSVEKHYSVVDASEGQVFIAVYHDINSTHLYLSEKEGIDYSLSLDYIISPPERDWTNRYPRFDVHVVEGIVGTYIANQKVTGSSYGASVISYDKGGEWVRLIPPALDYRGSSQICVPPSCSLHVHMGSDIVNGYQSILSQDSAVGLLMAQGNLGASLSGLRSSVRLYFSRDGGFTWFEVSSGFWEFQFAALGSVVVAVRKRTYTNTIQWSCDEGRSWQIDTFTNGPGILVVGMLTEREERARHVTIFGYRSGRWLITDLNFTSVVPNQCDMADYFDWLPTDDRPGSRCLLGEVITYERRNSTFCCYVDPLYDRPIGRIPCVCSIEDFECDFGFERLSLNSPCTPLPWIQWPPPPPSTCTEGGTYNISSGYRRVAGDKCIRGNEDYFFELVRQCPVLPPKGLLISFNGQSVRVNRTVSFSLTQLEGGKLNTSYVWNFNDLSPPLNVTGFAMGSSQNHIFSSPGQYTVRVVATNSGGSSQAITQVTVYDIVTSSTIIPPIQAGSTHSVPTGIQLLFNASLTTLYGTNIFGEVTYHWNFGDGPPKETYETIVSHTYQTPNNYTISLRIFAQFSRAQESSFKITVYESAKHVQIVGGGLPSSHWVQVGATTSFSVEKLPSATESIPPDTFYTWHLVPPNHLSPVTSTGNTFSYSFARDGSYDLSVVGNHSAGSFSTQIILNAEYYIGRVDIAYIPTVRAGDQSAVATITLYSKKGDPLTGTFSYHFLGEGGENFTNVEMLTTDGVASLQFLPSTVTRSKDIAVTLKVWNHISNSTGKKMVAVVVPGDYGSIRLEFPLSSLPSTFNSSSWMAALKEGITALVKSYNVSDILIEIESTVILTKSDESEVTSAPPDKAQRNHDILRRSTEQVFVVNVNILPRSASSSNISFAKDVADRLVSNGTVVVTVAGVQYTVDAVVRIVSRIIIDPAQNVYVTDWKRYSEIIGGLGVVLIVGVAVTVGLVLIVYYYRRRYNRLRVRYSRLSQAPVRFTFTQSGDMMEEEDPDINAEDTTCAEMDTDSQPLKKLK